MASPKRKTRKSASKNKKTSRVKASKATPMFKNFSFASLNYKNLESEINKLSDLLNVIKKKSSLVRKSLAYLEREQRKVSRQIHDAKRFLHKLKLRGMAALRNLPENAEELYYQLKHEFNRISQRLRA